MTTVSDFVSVEDVVAGSAAGVRGRLWRREYDAAERGR